jgi:hypothetical protein
MNFPKKEVWNGDYKCINIDCDRSIIAYIVEKQFTHPKNRVCGKCRNGGNIRWNCIGCGNIISNINKRVGTFYCSPICRSTSHFKRTYPKKIRPIKITNIKGCIYCTKRLTQKNAMKFCSDTCNRKHRMLEKHKSLYKQDMINRANMRMLIKKPNYDKDKRIKHKKKQQFYQKRRYNVNKLVTAIHNKQTYI